MSKFTEQLPEWQNTGSVAPPEVRASGWKIKDRPPAAWFNWLLNRAYACLREIRNVIDNTFSRYNADTYAVTSGTGSAYTVTLDPTPGAYVDGMRLTLKFHTNSMGGNITININGLGAIPLRLKTGGFLQKYDIKNNTLYDVCIVQSIAYLLDLKHKNIPPIALPDSDLNLALYDGVFTISSTNNTNTPTAFFSDYTGNYLLYITTIGATVFQRAVNMDTLVEFNRYLNTDTGAVMADWQIALGMDRRDFTRSSDILTDYSGSGLAFTRTGLNINVGIGHVYLPSIGLVVRKQQGNPVTLPINSTSYIGLDLNGNLILETAQSNKSLYRFTTNAIAVTQIVSVYMPYIRLKSGIAVASTPDMTDETTKVATTEFVRKAINMHSAPNGFGLGSWGYNDLTEIESLSVTLGNGWYKFSNGAIDAPVSGNGTLFQMNTSGIGRESPVQYVFMETANSFSGFNNNDFISYVTFVRNSDNNVFTAWRKADIDGTVIISSPTSLNTVYYQNATFFTANGTTALGFPSNGAYFVKVTAGTNTVLQEAFEVSTGKISTRTYNGTTWTNWLTPTDSSNFLSAAPTSTQTGSIGSLKIRNTQNSNHAQISYNPANDTVEITFGS